MLVPLQQVEVDHLLAAGDETHVERLLPDGPDRAERELEGLTGDEEGGMDLSGHVCRRRSEPREALVGKWRHDHPVERLATMGAYTELLVDLAFLEEGRRLDLRERGVLLAIDRPLEHGVGALAIEGVHGPQDGPPFLESAKKVCETDLPARGKARDDPFEIADVHPGEVDAGLDTSPRAAACRRQHLAHRGDGAFLLRLRSEITHEIALTACMRISFSPPGIHTPRRARTPSPPTSGNAARIRPERRG